MSQVRKRSIRFSRQGLPADGFKLTDEERSMLPDPDFVSEDDADFIIGTRRERAGGKSVSLEEVLSESAIKSPGSVPYIASTADKPKKKRA